MDIGEICEMVVEIKGVSIRENTFYFYVFYFLTSTAEVAKSLKFAV